MTDSVDFKAAKECAISYLDCEDVMPKTFNLSRAYLALCELLKEASPMLGRFSGYSDSTREDMQRRINAVIGA